MCVKIRNINDLKELKEKGFNNPYTQREFELNVTDEIEYLLENYLDNFAFGIKYKGKDYTFIRHNDIIYARDNSKYKFEFPHCPPSISEVFDLKTNLINEIISIMF